MTPILENGVLGTDLNAAFFDLLNVNALDPPPPNLATSDDIRLSDSRPPIPGSVTDASVNAAAAIAQSKLALTGAIPSAWLGTASGTAARGDQAEYLANKNQPGGYAGLDGSGKIPASVLPGATGTGTVTSVGLTMPATFTVSGSPVTAAGTLGAAWAAVTDQSWFGRNAGSPGAPQFYTTPLPVALIPSLDASIVGSGTFAPARLPVAVGIGISHAPGAVPDPGDGSVGLGTDYLSRDMSFKPLPAVAPGYQPALPNPTFSVGLGPGYPKSVVIQSTVSGVVFFYSLTSSSTGFIESPDGSLTVPATGTLYAYVASPGYNNSAVVSTPV